MDIGVFFPPVTTWGLLLAVAFSAFWLLALAPVTWRRPWSWLVLVAGAVLFAPAVAWVQAPLQELIGGWFLRRLGPQGYFDFLPVAGIPAVLLSGLIQEAVKLVPVAAYWWRKGRQMSPAQGLSIGAMAGAGFAIFEAQWVLNGIFTTGWDWGAVGLGGTLALVERFTTAGFHVAAGALVGWGVAIGRGWRLYLLASLLHSVVNYSTVLLSKEMLSAQLLEVYVGVLALATFGAVLWLRRHPGGSAVPAAQ